MRRLIRDGTSLIRDGIAYSRAAYERGELIREEGFLKRGAN